MYDEEIKCVSNSFSTFFYSCDQHSQYALVAGWENEYVYPNELTLKVCSSTSPYYESDAYTVTCLDTDSNLYKFTCPDELTVAAGEWIVVYGDWIELIAPYGDRPADLEEDHKVAVFTNGLPIELNEEWNGVMWLKMNVTQFEFGTAVFSNNKDFVPEWAWHLSGIKGVSESEESAIRYFDIHGVEIANPDKGIYIQVTGDKSEKIRF